MTQYALVGWLILCWPLITDLWNRDHGRWKPILAALGFSSVLGGIVVMGSLLTALQTSTFADEIAPFDAVMLQSYWDMLAPESDVLDSDPWRAVVVTGRLTRSSASGYETLPMWEQLVRDPFVGRIVTAGFDYVYIDQYWWDSMSGDQQSSYEDACVLLVDEAFDNAANGARWLYDLRACE